MDARTLYSKHLAQLNEHGSQALEHAAAADAKFERILFDAGRESFYHADDENIPFRTVPHFARWTPVPGADHLLLFEPGRTPRLLQVAAADFWHEPPAAIDHPYATELEVEVHGSRTDAMTALGSLSGCAYIGSDPDTARKIGLPDAAIEPQALVAALDWYRAYKSAYEIECIRDAARLAGQGHAVVRAGVAERSSEWELHRRYLEATGCLEHDTPYPNIIAWDRHSATLHYRSKRKVIPDPGCVLLIDAGGSSLGYASDITRTWIRNGAHAVFVEARDRMEVLQRELVNLVEPGRDYADVHVAAHRGIASILTELDIVKCSADAAFERGLTRVFLPHGVGHHLGLQVHDVGGRQINPRGDTRPPHPAYPFLRTTRNLEASHVVTIEPGLYFIPLLLDPHRNGEGSDAFNWSLIDELVTCGGIRIEDDIAVTADGREDLTRPYVPGHRD